MGSKGDAKDFDMNIEVEVTKARMSINPLNSPVRTSPPPENPDLDRDDETHQHPAPGPVDPDLGAA